MLKRSLKSKVLKWLQKLFYYKDERADVTATIVFLQRRYIPRFLSL